MKHFLFISTICCTLLASCSNHTTTKGPFFNEAAVLPDDMLRHTGQWKVITTLYDRTHKTMSALYGNEVALQQARAGQAYTAGSSLCLVTWTQQDDAHWFGGRLPGETRLVEWLRFGTDAQPVYERYEGHPLQRNTSGSAAFTNERIHFIGSRKAQVMP